MGTEEAVDPEALVEKSQTHLREIRTERIVLELVSTAIPFMIIDGAIGYELVCWE